MGIELRQAAFRGWVHPWPTLVDPGQSTNCYTCFANTIRILQIQYSTNKYRAIRDNIDRRFNTGKPNTKSNHITQFVGEQASAPATTAPDPRPHPRTRRFGGSKAEKGEESPFLKAFCSRELRFEVRKRPISSI